MAVEATGSAAGHVATTASSERIGRPLAGIEPLQLCRRERRVEQERRLLEAPEHLGDEVHAIAEVGPVDSPGFPRVIARWIDPIEKIAKLGEGDLTERRRELDAEILAQLEVDGGPKVDGHEVASQDASNERLRFEHQRVDGEIEQRASPEQPGDQDAQPNQPAGMREQGRDDTIPHVAWIDDGGVEGSHDLGLETGLLVESDLQVGEEDELCTRHRVDLETRPMVVGERLAQVALPFRRFAWDEPIQEPGEGVRADRSIPAALQLEAHELAADLLEHPEVATGDCGARPIQCRCRIEDLPHGPERIADRDVSAESACLGRDLARGVRRRRRDSKRRLQRALEILLADRPSGLLGGPGRIRAPVGDGPEARRRGGREVVIGLRDLEVADHEIGHANDPIDVLGGHRAPGG